MVNKKQIILKYNRPGPRYTSYPPANFFKSEFNNNNFITQIEESNNVGQKNISIYIHIPFCSQRCHFCGCNTTLFENETLVSKYVDCLIKEIHSVTKHINTQAREVTQIHWGGGTPNSIQHKHIERVMNELKTLFKIKNNAEIAIECNPAYIDNDQILFLRKMGFNRISIGIQDFNTKILDCVNRLRSKLPHNELIKMVREAGFTGVNYDFIYGLPGQTVESFNETIKQAIELSPDRLVTFSYAHVPWATMSQQKNLEKIGLPSPEEKLSMFLSSMDLIVQSGYIQIGLDHYAKPNDDLSKALLNKRLHRNFQGYCTKETTGQVYGFGSSSISQLWGGFSQNEKTLIKYIERIENEELAVERGYSLSFNEQVCKEVIDEIMCNGVLNFDEVGNIFLISALKVKEIICYNNEKFKEFVDDNLLEITNNKLIVSKSGMLVVRNIAMALDPQLNTEGDKYSKTI
ncbi:MAG: oxygen-independent coproporphyrinogen III oxidase [Bacteroidetes bacterium GWA2_32_17]|nr:MAG: oxygen-independent coproporphyrinogen III oxidase [Bacteroidetes bacterium GWA2_32_17]